jgi:hypothetical protein
MDVNFDVLIQLTHRLESVLTETRQANERNNSKILFKNLGLLLDSFKLRANYNI